MSSVGGKGIGVSRLCPGVSGNFPRGVNCAVLRHDYSGRVDCVNM
jgi:hypothetical protein